MTCVKKGLSELALDWPRSSIMGVKLALSMPLFVDLVLTIYCFLLKDIYCIYRENKLSVPPLRFFRIRPVKFV